MVAATLGTILPNLSERFGLTPSQNVSMAFAQALGLILASLAVGPLLDAEGKKVGLVLGLSLILIALAALPRSSGYRTLIVLMFVMGVGGGIVITGANALASDVGGVHRGSVLNLVNLFFGLGGFVTPFLAANLFGKNWVRLCYSIAGFTAVTLAFEIATRMPAPVAAHSSSFAGAGHLLRQPVLWMLGFFLFLYVSCEVGVWNWLPQHLIAQGIPKSRALNVLSGGFALGLLFGRVQVSPVLIHVPATAVLLFASVAMSIPPFFMLRTRKPGVALAFVATAGISMAPVFPTTLAVVGDMFPAVTGTAIGFAITCGWIGLAVSSRTIGGIAGGDALQLRKALLVIPASAVLMVMMSLIIIALHTK